MEHIPIALDQSAWIRLIYAKYIRVVIGDVEKKGKDCGRYHYPHPRGWVGNRGLD